MNRELLQRALDALMSVECSMKQIGISVAAHGVFKQTGASITELRAALAAPAAPLTDEQIRAERDRIGAAFGFMDGVRYAERAHGIKP